MWSSWSCHWVAADSYSQELNPQALSLDRFGSWGADWVGFCGIGCLVNGAATFGIARLAESTAKGLSRF